MATSSVQSGQTQLSADVCPGGNSAQSTPGSGPTRAPLGCGLRSYHIPTSRRSDPPKAIICPIPRCSCDCTVTSTSASPAALLVLLASLSADIKSDCARGDDDRLTFIHQRMKNLACMPGSRRHSHLTVTSQETRSMKSQGRPPNQKTAAKPRAVWHSKPLARMSKRPSRTQSEARLGKFLHAHASLTLHQRMCTCLPSHVPPKASPCTRASLFPQAHSTTQPTLCQRLRCAAVSP